MRNEYDNIEKLKETVCGQTALPRQWVISVDANSTDGTYERALEVLGPLPWVKVVTGASLKEDGYSPKNFARTVNSALEYALTSGPDVPYIGKTDAEVRLDKNYFEFLLAQMQKDDNLAICCGLGGGKLNPDDPLSGFNDIRLYRKDFLSEIHGYPICFSPDTVVLVKALNRKRKTAVFPEVTFSKKTLPGSKIGRWRGAKLRGRGLYSIGYRPGFALASAAYQTMYYPYFTGMALAYGYIGSALRREERIKDREVLDYFARRRLVRRSQRHITERRGK